MNVAQLRTLIRDLPATMKVSLYVTSDCDELPPSVVTTCDNTLILSDSLDDVGPREKIIFNAFEDREP